MLTDWFVGWLAGWLAGWLKSCGCGWYTGRCDSGDRRSSTRIALDRGSAVEEALAEVPRDVVGRRGPPPGRRALAHLFELLVVDFVSLVGWFVSFASQSVS